jgi:peptide/nickel transport system ATP-binding protein
MEMKGLSRTATTTRVAETPPVAATAAHLLDVRNLTVRYRVAGGVVTAVGNVSFTVGRGERVGLVGESGSGKTGTCLAVAGFLASNAEVSSERLMFGDVDLGGRRAARIPKRVPGLAMVFQDAGTSLDPVWTIGSQLRSVIRATQKTSRKQATALATDWLRKVGLTDTERVMRSRPYELSGGMAQRAMIAIALSGTPELLIADEPTSALDASLARDVMKLLVDLTDELGSGLVLVSHDIHLCQEFVDRMLVMYGGHVVESGYAATLDADAAHPYTQALLRSVPTLDSAGLDELPTIPLSMTGQGDPQGGCAFRPRCEYAHDACSVTPPLIELPARDPAGASAACWLADESAIPAVQVV